MTLRSGHFPLLFCVKNEEQTVMCGSSLCDGTHQNKLEGMVVVLERAWLKPGNWAGVRNRSSITLGIAGRKRAARKGLNGNQSPK